MGEINYWALLVIIAVYVVVQSIIIVIKMERRERNLFQSEYLGCYVYSDMTYRKYFQDDKEVIGVIVQVNKGCVTIMKCCNFRFAGLWDEVPMHLALLEFMPDIIQIRRNEFLSEVNRNSSLNWKLATEQNYQNLFANLGNLDELLAQADDNYYQQHRVEPLPVGVCADKHYAYDGEDLNVYSFSFADGKIKDANKGDYMRLVTEVKFEELRLS